MKEEWLKSKVERFEEDMSYSSGVEEELWGLIESKRSPKKKQLNLNWISGIAASLLLGTALIYFISNSKIESGETLSFSIEEEIDTSSPKGENSDLVLAKELISSQCAQVAEVCKSPEFIELQNELSLLETEIIDLENMISQYGEDDLLIQSKIKIENHKSEITQKMIQIIMS